LIRIDPNTIDGGRRAYRQPGPFGAPRGWPGRRVPGSGCWPPGPNRLPRSRRWPPGRTTNSSSVKAVARVAITLFVRW